MSFDICVKAPAKVNIGLRVLQKQANGYHNIESVFQTIGIFDELHIRKINKKECVVHCAQMPLPLENTLTKTYKAFCANVAVDFGVDIWLDKVLPAGGGLGGGSSDGAALLKVLAGFAQVPLTPVLADAVASRVGSDVFFFLHSGFFQNGHGCALVSGRGEVVEPITPRTDLTFLLVFPGIHSSTKDAYELVDKAHESGQLVECPDFSELKSLYYDSLKKWTFANSFTPAIVNQYPVVGKALQDVRKFGADWAEMSGSGATVFGVFESVPAAERAFELCQKKWKCVLAH